MIHAPDSAGVPGWPLRDTLVVQVAASDGAPRSGAIVQWEVRLGNGAVMPLSDTTDAAGFAAALWTLGQPGPNRLRASTLNGDSVTFDVDAAVFRTDLFDSAYKLGCGLVSGGIWCWGNSLGDEGSPSVGPPVDVFLNEGGWAAELVDASRQYVRIAVSDHESFCALDAAGSPWCGTLPLVSGAPPVFTITQPSGVPALFTVVSADDYSSSGSNDFCGLAVADSTAWCINAGGTGRAVTGSPSLTSLAAGEGWYCGIRADSLAVCWGDGPLGDGVTLSSALPVEVAGGHRFVELGSDRTFACGLTAGAEVYCWSAGEAPAQVAAGVSDLAVGDGLVMVLQSGTPRVGRGPDFDTDSVSPLTGFDGRPVTELSAGSTSCVRLVGAEMYCWNELWINSSAQLLSNYSPVQPPPSDP